MNDIQTKHHQAMEFADNAFAARRQGDKATADEQFRQAFDYERQAAKLIAPDESAEPTRSVLHRSAATLALDCGEYREAERLIARALAGNPPESVANELRNLLDQVYERWGYRQRQAAAG